MQQPQQIDERLSFLSRLIEQAPPAVRLDFEKRLDLSWIHHDSALEGTVYTPSELIPAIKGDPPPDASLVATYDEIRQNKAALDLVREMATRKRFKLDMDAIRDLYGCLAPDEVEGKKPPQYRKDMPVHRLYFHDIATPDKILPKLKQFVEWVNSPETRKSTHTVRLAAKSHFYLLHIYPYPKHSGKVGRLVMNLLLLQAGYPPAIIHATERHRYYEALKSNENAVAQVVREALETSIESAVRFFEQYAPPPEQPKKRNSARPKAARAARA